MFSFPFRHHYKPKILFTTSPSFRSRFTFMPIKPERSFRSNEPVKTHLKGAALLQDPMVNKGSAFTRQERKQFDLEAHLPYEVHPIEYQLERAKAQLDDQPNDVLKHAFLVSLREQNLVLFYRLVLENLKQLLPILYTPTVSAAVKKWSQLFRRPEGAYISYPHFEPSDPKTIERLLATHAPPPGIEEGKRPFDLVVVTDAEQILGIGDQGVGGMSISEGKAALYTLGAGIDPARILSVQLDVGTDNKDHLNNKLYLGWKHECVRGDDYDAFVDAFVKGAQSLWPGVLIHFEDFGRENAARLLDKYRKDIPVFNDDVQGTGCVVLATLLAAMGSQKSKLADQKYLIYGGGTAGTGIADWITRAMVQLDGVKEEDAKKQIWLVDQQGLLTTSTPDVVEHQKPYLRSADEVKGWSSNGDKIDLFDAVKSAKPTVLIGTSGQASSWDKKLVKTVLAGLEVDQRPIFMPLSNPTKLEEATPDNLIDWTDGRALVATGSPFPPVKHPKSGKEIEIGEANNAMVFPALGFGTILAGAERLSDSLMLAGIRTLANVSPAHNDPGNGALLPDLSQVREVSVKIASAVVAQAVKDKVARRKDIPDNDEEREDWTRRAMWVPEYRPLEYLQ